MTHSDGFFSSRWHNVTVQIPYLTRTFKLIWDASRHWTVAWLALLVFQGVLPVATVYLTRLLVDSLVVVLDSEIEMASVRPLFIGILLMALVLLAQGILGRLSTIISTAQSERVRDHISELIHLQALTVDLGFYDSPDFYDHLHRARWEAVNRPIALLQSTGILLQNSITLVSMALVLATYAWWLPLALLVSTLPAVYIVLGHRRRLHNWRMLTTKDERQAWYYEYLMTARESAAELRLFNLGTNFRFAFQVLRKKLREERLKLARDQGLSEMLAGVLALFITGLAMLWMLWRVILGEYSLGDMAMFYSAFNQGQSLMRNLLDQVGEIYANSLFLADLFAYLELQPQVLDPPHPRPAPVDLLKGIQFEGVSFHYPGSQRLVLDDFSLQIPTGQIAAIVGPNGAGKSTLVKLLCRFYDPQVGMVRLDGIDVRDLALADLRRLMTVLFQAPVLFQDMVRENIAWGDIERIADQAEIEAAAQAAGADSIVDRLPDGYDTQLGKWFEGGNELSVGEWQRVALARAFYRRAPIILLDEPTSAMDPWAEADWLRRFRKLALGKTAIIITHRFTTAAYADVIHVMDEGRIVESGDHHTLLNQGGRYAQSWKDQIERWFKPNHEGAAQTQPPPEPVKPPSSAGDGMFPGVEQPPGSRFEDPK